jgi:hypothetical protein
MEERETITKDSIEYLLRLILGSKHNCGGSNTHLVDVPLEIPASPEEGVHLICAFIRIKQPELRAAIVKLATQMADVQALTMPIPN